MKIRLFFYLRVTLPLFFLFFCTTREEVTPMPVAEIVQSAVLADALSEFKQSNFSMQPVAAFMKKSYGVDLGSAYGKVVSRLTTDHDLLVEALGQDIEMKDVVTILHNNGITEGTAAFRYLMSLSRLFDENKSGDDMPGNLNQLRLGVLSDRALEAAERDRLATTFTLLANNYKGIADCIQGEIKTSSNERTQGWFGSRAWRVIRSVVITAAIGAWAGSNVNPYVAIAGGVIMGAAALADASANNNCHFAVQCSAGWRQDCDTGECKPYIQ